MPGRASRSVAAAPGPTPKYLRAGYLSETEGLLRETRATGLYYLPGPILYLIVFGILGYGAASARYDHLLPAFPYLTSAFQNSYLRFGSGRFGRDLPWVILFGLLELIGLLWLLVRYLRWIRTIYAITTHRVIVQRGILGREFDEIPIPQVRGVDVRQSFGQRILGYGTVRVSAETGSVSSIGNEDWLGIPRPFDFQRIIESASQAIASGQYSAARPAPPAAPR